MLTFQELIPGCVRASEFAPFYLVFDDGKRRLATDQEVAAVRAAQQGEQAKRQESDTARSEAKQAYSELQPLIEHKDPAIALLAAIMQKHLLATLGR